MKNFTQYINEHRDEFDDMEPELGHFQRFETRLNRKSKVKILEMSNFRQILSVAAVVSFVLVTTFTAYIFGNKYFTSQNSAMANVVTSEIQEAESYYTSNYDSKLNELLKLECGNFESQKQSILSEIGEIDFSIANIHSELTFNKNNDYLQNALINCYQKKIELVEQIIQIVKKNC